MRVLKVIAGFALLLSGIVMLAAPGPGWLTIAAGLALLAAEYPWARRALDTVKSTAVRWRRPKKEDRDGDNHREADLESSDPRHRGP